MKKILSLTLSVVLLLGLCCGVAFAADPTVYVTISDKDGKLVLTQEPIAVKDVDSDGKITINDALYCAHDAKFSGGAAAGYSSEMTEYGLSLKKLWGIDNGTGYGYYVNNAAAMSLGDEVKDGAYITAFVYTDTANWSDAYSFFDKNTASVKAGDTVAVELKYVGYDASFNTVIAPAKGATILVNGKATDVKTDNNGKASVKLTDAGTVIISAKSDSQTLVPPALVVKVSAASGGESPKTADNTMLLVFGALAVVSFAGVAIASRKESRA
ncbi:MAG: hypothetical protein II553_05650 [Lachnospiraceae bacterium]|nr:hypothetical protein [Lachnospiraceae bacterium]MBQ2558476.1 hypothetical protein [Lachnospiraceae bacterium]